METHINYEQIADFQINIENLVSGWESISLLFNDNPITFRASYIGQEPLGTLIEAVKALDKEYVSGSNESKYFIDWLSEPGSMSLSLKRNLLNNQLSLEIKVSESEDINNSSMIQWNFVMNFSLFRQAVVDIAISTLNKYGICGFNHNWHTDNDVLPVGSLLSILGAKTSFNKGNGSFKSDLTQEISLLTSIISHKGRI